jgi:hypothetical protein
MYEIIGINYERAQSAPSVIRKQGRTPEILNEVYEHGKALWDSSDCSKYLVALFLNGKMLDYNRPDSWNFENRRKFNEETSHFTDWDYSADPCPYKDRKHHEGEARKFYARMCATYQKIMREDGVAV